MTTRSQKSHVISSVASPLLNKRVENSWILLIKDSLFENGNFSIITLPHPANGTPTKYCLDDVHKKMYEVITFSEPYRSWFIGDTVKSDGSLLIVTPVNPLFLVLPRLKKQCSSRAVPLEDLLSEKGYDKILDYIGDLDAIADLKGPSDIKAYKYNENKTLNWLEQRIRKLAIVLREKQIHVSSGAVSATFVSSDISKNSLDEEFYLKYAHGMVSEYLQDEVIEILEKRFNFKPELVESLGQKRKSNTADNCDTNKRVKNEQPEDKCNENKQDIINMSVGEVKKQKPLTAKEKARQRAASGTKTISAFFAKK